MAVEIDLERILKEKGFSKNAFARLLKVKDQAVRPYFRKGYDPKLSTLVKWAKILKCEVKELIHEPKRPRATRNNGK